MSKGQHNRPWPRSFLRNQGHLTKAQRRALRELWPAYGVTLEYGQVLDPFALFGRSAPLVLEIGFGRGEALVAMAKAHPEVDFIAVEAHKPGVGAAIQTVHRESLTNVRLIRADGLQLLRDHLAEHSLHAACIFFPDPWHRTDQKERRIIRPFTLELLERVLKPGARLHFATDVAPYFEHAKEVLDAQPGWHFDVLPHRPSWRIETHYEAKGRDEGRPSQDLCATWGTEAIAPALDNACA